MSRNEKQALEIIKRLSGYGEQAGPNSLYQQRLARNIGGLRRRTSQRDAWDGILIAILSTMQRSTGRSNLVRQILREGRVRWSAVATHPSLIDKEVVGFNHNRKKRTRLKAAVPWFQEHWPDLRADAREIASISINDFERRYPVERAAAEFLSEQLDGVGPKQSRNFWQYLGFSAWTLPLDSRIRAVLEHPPFSFDPGMKYEDLEWEVIQLCRRAGTYPCLLDASLFDLEGLMRSLAGLPYDEV